jgi:catechol 2,3-dioxygenase-like lactoylglutathione lyase family enzyme
MTKLDPIIAVKDVEKSSQWYQAVFGFKSMHGGNEFDVLNDENDKVVICLHRWGEHDHPTMKDATNQPGNGLILYFRTDKMEKIHQNAERIGHPIASEIQLNPNSNYKEFSVRDLDGYYLTISEFHKYKG